MPPFKSIIAISKCSQQIPPKIVGILVLWLRSHLQIEGYSWSDAFFKSLNLKIFWLAHHLISFPKEGTMCIV